MLVTRGSDEGIDLLTRVFCRAGEDAVLQCPPTFGMYRIAAQTQGAKVLSVPRDGESFRLNEQGLLDSLRQNPSVKLVFLTSPNNPTGDSVDGEFLRLLLEAAKDRAIVVMDEAYAEFCDQPSSTAMLEAHENLVVLRTMSKAWGAAGLRCGTVLAQPALIALLRRIIAPYPLPSPVVELALRMLEDDALSRQQNLLTEIAQSKRLLLAQLRSRAFIREVVPGEANFVLIRVDEADRLLRFSAQRGVILRAVSGFPSAQRVKSERWPPCSMNGRTPDEQPDWQEAPHTFYRSRRHLDR